LWPNGSIDQDATW